MPSKYRRTFVTSEEVDRTIDARTVRSPSAALRAMVRAYEELVARYVPALSGDEWVVVSSALAMDSLDVDHLPLASVPAIVADAIKSGRVEADGIDGVGLVEELSKLEHVELLAVVDLVVRGWVTYQRGLRK